MAIFSLKKYDQTLQEPTEENKEQQQDNNDQTEKTIFIKTDNTISDIIVEILYKNFKKEDINEVNEEKDSYDVEIVSTESINEDFVKTYKNLKSNNIFVYSKDRLFKTMAEEWFLHNLENRNIIVTATDFINTLKSL